MLSNMHKHRSASGVTVLDGEIYACGGHDGLSIYDSVSVIYDVFKYFGCYFYLHVQLYVTSFSAAPDVITSLTL